MKRSIKVNPKERGLYSNTPLYIYTHKHNRLEYVKRRGTANSLDNPIIMIVGHS